MKCPGPLAAMFFAGLLTLAAPGICSAQGGGHGGGGGGHGFGGFGGHGGGKAGHGLAGNGSVHASGHAHSTFHFLGWGRKSTPAKAAGADVVATTKGTPANAGMASPWGFMSRPRPGTAFVMEAPFQVHHHRGHFGFGGCPEVGLSRSLFARSDFDCYSGGVDPPIVGGSPRYDFPVTGEGFLGGTEGAGATQAFGERASSDQPRTLLALEDGSEFALRDYWLEGHKLQYVTSYGGQNSLPVERIDLARTVKDNSERGAEFVLRPRPARTSEKAVRP